MLNTLFLSLTFVISHYLVIFALAVVAFALGDWLATTPGLARVGMRLKFTSLAENFAIATTLGLGALGTILFVLGCFGLLTPASLAALVALVVIGCGPSCFRATRGWLQGCAEPPLTPPLLKALALVLFLPAVILALYPPIGFDATLYHLPYAQLFAANHGLVTAEHLRFPVFPHLHDLLFMLVLTVADDVAAQLTQMLSFLLTAMIAFCWGQRWSNRAGIWAAGLCLGEPISVAMGTSAYVDSGLACFTALSMYAYFIWRNAPAAQRPDNDGWLAVAAFAAACGAATKYHGLFFCLVLALGTVWDLRQNFRFKPLAIVALVGILIAGPTYLRIYLETGTPVFPFFRGTVEAVAPAPSHAGALSTTDAFNRAAYPRLTPPRERPTALQTLTNFIRLPWDWTINFMDLPGPKIPLSPAYLLALPFVLFYGLRSPPCRGPILITVSYLAFWMLTIRDPRYLLPGLALLSVVIAISMDRCFEDLGRKFRFLARHSLPVGLLTVLLPGACYAAAILWLNGPLPIDLVGREDFLLRRVGTGYQSIHLLNATRASDYRVYAIRSENLIYYADGELTGDQFGPKSYGLLAPWIELRVIAPAQQTISRTNSDGLLEILRRFDAEYFLVPDCERRFRFPVDSKFERSFELVSRGYEKYPGESCLYRLSSAAKQPEHFQ